MIRYQLEVWITDQVSSIGKCHEIKWENQELETNRHVSCRL